MTNLFYNYFGTFTTFWCLLPLLIGLINFKFLKKELRPIFILLIVIVIIEISNRFLSNKEINTYPLTRIYSLLEFLCLSFFYKRFFSTHFNTAFFYFIALAFFSIALLDAFVINSIYTSDNLASATEGIVVIIYAVSAFYLIMKKMIYSNILSEPFFWINSAYLIYFSGTLFLFLFLNYIFKSKPQYFVQIYFINSVLNLVNYTLITIGFWKARKA